ncbi:MAG: nucleoside-diphosphate-sugar epimerase [Planctomycetota bacterium]|jgi:nucleoside-diphosphate-sugar epimerase|uniref:SDR family NAD(P)-dependent oxidoreductase n=1 Tax=Patiriisocius sp. Uisw_047 TaxID=3230969 RepID=UPI0039EB1E54
MSKTIAIAGLGWLGIPLARKLMMQGYLVKGSVTSVKKATTLQAKGIDAYAVDITEEGVEGASQALLKNAAILIIMIPPGLRRNSGSNYVLKMSHFLREVKANDVHDVIFISSTSVYGDAQGVVTERDLPTPENDAGRQLFQTEQLFFNAPGLRTSIVRFGGLMGGTRQPVKYLAGRKDLSGGNAPVNLIHRDDCIGVISEIIKQEHLGKIFNAVHPSHPLKKTYYTAKAETLGLEPPIFSEDTEVSHKQVDSVNVKLVLGYTFKNEL